MILGYARVSTDDQSTRLQLDALSVAGCDRTFYERTAGATTGRPVLVDLLSHARRGDTVVVWRLDRLGRSLPHLIEIVQRLEANGVVFRSLIEGIDTATADGQLFLSVVSALAQFERELTRERAQVGLASARARGNKGGRPRRMTPDCVRTARRLLSDPEATVSKVAEALGVHRSTLYKALQALSPATGSADSSRRMASELPS